MGNDVLNGAKKAAVLGGGNVGTWLAAACSARGMNVTIYSSRPGVFGENIEVIGDTPDLSYQAKIGAATDNLEDAVRGRDIIFVTYPTFLYEETAAEIYRLFKDESNKPVIGLLPGAFGDIAFKQCVESGFEVFGLQRVPGVARIIEYGKSVRVSGLRREIFLSSIPRKNEQKYAELMSDIFGIKCSPLANYLCNTLVPSNSILHTGRLYEMFRDADKKYDRNILFYEEWDDQSSATVLAMDTELQNICRCIRGIDLSGVVSLKKHYESDTPQAMTAKIKSIKSFKGLTSPMKEVDGSFVPDLKSRYFSADFPFGLGVIQAFARMANVKTPTIDKVMSWYLSRAESDAKSCFDLSTYGLGTLGELCKYYKR